MGQHYNLSWCTINWVIFMGLPQGQSIRDRCQLSRNSKGLRMVSVKKEGTVGEQLIGDSKSEGQRAKIVTFGGN